MLGDIPTLTFPTDGVTTYHARKSVKGIIIRMIRAPNGKFGRQVNLFALDIYVHLTRCGRWLLHLLLLLLTTFLPASPLLGYP